MSAPYLHDVLEDVETEAERARRLFGDNDHLTDLEWLAVLAEEFGEVARIVTQTSVRPITDTRDRRAEVREELIQVAAVAGRWARAIDRRARPGSDA